MSIPISCNKCKKFLKDYGISEHINVAVDGRYLCDKCYEDERVLKKIQSPIANQSKDCI